MRAAAAKTSAGSFHRCAGGPIAQGGAGACVKAIPDPWTTVISANLPLRKHLPQVHVYVHFFQKQKFSYLMGDNYYYDWQQYYSKYSESATWYDNITFCSIRNERVL